MIKAIIFDADGVLILAERFSEILDRDFGIPLEMTRSFFEGPFQKCRTGELDLKEAINPFLTDWGWHKGVDAFLDLWFEVDYKLDQELIEYIKALRQKGILCILATNQEKRRFWYMLDRLGFAGIFDRTYVSAHL